MLQGLTGQRIAILNNGSKLEGQQWGFDHAPEMDPSAADRISVVKGAQAVRYGADAIGGVVLVEQQEINPNLKGIHLRSTSGFNTNGKGLFQHLMVEKRLGKWKQFGIRLGVTRKTSGSFSTPRYIMGNTGLREAGISGLINHQRGKWKSELWASYYTTQFGLFSGSHLSTPEAIRQAINRPDSTYSYGFSFTIDRPKQAIQHFQTKGKVEYQLNENESLILSYTHQIDNRKEYDVIRKTAECSSCPQLLFRLESQQAEVGYQVRKENYEGRTAVVGVTQGNVVERKILIPNFRLYQGGAYTVHTWYRGTWAWEAGARTEFRRQQIFRYVGQVFENPVQQFGLYMVNVGFRKEMDEHWHVKFNTQISQRAPNANEQFSNGVHHGTASYEEGDESLKPERIWNSGLSLHHRSKHWQLLVNAFLTWSPNFIYLTPVGDSIITTIRGPFPYYRYRADEVWMKGLDFNTEYDVTKSITLMVKGMGIRSWNLSRKSWLIFQPADRIEPGVRLRRPIAKGHEIEINATSTWVAKQYRAPDRTDFAEAPGGYMLWAGLVAWKKSVGKIHFDLSVEGRNILNKTYRDYMNRFRYFSYDLGRSILIRLTIHIGNQQST